MEQDQEVQFKRHVLDVEKVVLELFLRLLDRAAVMEHDLRPSGDPGFDRVAEGVIRDHGLQFFHEFRTLRTGTHEFQIPDQDVEQLRQFVDPRFPEELADSRDAGIVLHRPYRVPGLFRVVPHRAEFIDPDRLVILPNPDLRIENGAGGIDTDEERDDEKDRQQEDQEHGSHNRGDEPTDHEKEPGFPKALIENEKRWREAVDRDSSGEFLEKSGPFEDRDSRYAQGQHFRDGIFTAPLRDRHNDLADVVF